MVRGHFPGGAGKRAGNHAGGPVPEDFPGEGLHAGGDSADHRSAGSDERRSGRNFFQVKVSSHAYIIVTKKVFSVNISFFLANYAKKN